MSFLTQVAYNILTQLLRVAEQDPIDQHFENSWVDVDDPNVSGTSYYPSALGSPLDGRKDLSFVGEMGDADGTITISLEVANGPDPATAKFVEVMGRDDIAGFDKLSWAITNGSIDLAISFNNINYKWFRVKKVSTGATNDFSLQARRKAL